MNPSHLMLRRSVADAMARYGARVGVPELALPLKEEHDA
jgi:hypothetical protein